MILVDNMNKGFFIVFEGIEACGKTTQAILLSEKLKRNKYNVVLTREPGGTKFGEKVRELLLHSEDISPQTELFLFLADRKEHIEKLIKPALSEKKIVISDRYFYSTIAYQIGGRKMEASFVKQLNTTVVENVLPDVIFYLDLPVENAFARKSSSKLDRIEKENLLFHNDIRNEYQKISKEYENFILIDATLSIEEIHYKICSKLEKYNFKFA